MIDLSKDQLQDTIQSLLNKDEGLNELLEMILDELMSLERNTFLSRHALTTKLTVTGLDAPVAMARKLSLRIPTTGQLSAGPVDSAAQPNRTGEPAVL